MSDRGPNPYARVDPLGEFMRGWKSIESIRDDIEDRKDREQRRADSAEDRQYTRGRRAREVTLDERSDTVFGQQQADRAADEPVRAAQRTANIALAEDTPQRVAYDQGQRAYEEGGRLTPAQQQRKNELSLESAEGTVAQQGATLENTKATTANTRETTRGSRIRNDVTEEVVALDRQIAALDSGQFKALERPEYRAQAMDLYEDLVSGKGLRAPDKLYGFVNDTFQAELATGVGDKVQGTDDVIASKRISAMYEDPKNPDNVLIELDVQAKRKDGAVYDYKAPVTKNRRSDDTDEVLSLPKAKLMQRLQGVVGASLDVEQGASIAEMRAQLVARRDALSGATGKGRRGGGGGSGETAYERNAQFVARHKFGGDVEKALDWIKGKGAQTQVMELTKMLATQQKQDLEERRIKRDQVLTTDQLMARAVEMQTSLAGGVPKGEDTDLDPASSSAGPAAAAPSGGSVPPGMTVVGRTPDDKTVYEDSEGNQFVEE